MCVKVVVCAAREACSVTLARQAALDIVCHATRRVPAHAPDEHGERNTVGGRGAGATAAGGGAHHVRCLSPAHAAQQRLHVEPHGSEG